MSSFKERFRELARETTLFGVSFAEVMMLSMTLMYFWSWFVVPVTHFANLSLLGALGMVYLWTLFKGEKSLIFRNLEKNVSFKTPIKGIFKTLILLAAGFFIHSVM